MIIQILTILFGIFHCSSADSQPSSYRLLRLYHNKDVDPFYYIKLQVGYPPMVQKVVFDTGSSALVLKASNCEGCTLEDNPFYRQQNSESYSPIMCDDEEVPCTNRCPQIENNKQLCKFQFSFANKATEIDGSIAFEDIRFEGEGDRDRFQGKIFLTSKATGVTKLRQNGVLGLGTKRNEVILEQWFKRHNIDQKKYRFCLAKKGGSFEIGIPQTEQTEKKPDVKVDILHDSYFLQTNEFTSIQVLQTVITQQQKEGVKPWAVFDTGSVATYFPLESFNTFEAIVAKICEDHPNCKKNYRLLQSGFKNLCFKIDGLGKFFKSDQTLIDGILPAIDFKFNQSTITWKASEYVQIEKTAKGHYACLTILPGDQFLLGSNWLKYKRVTVDSSSNSLEIETNFECSFGNAISISEIVYQIKSAPGVLLYLAIIVIVLVVCFKHRLVLLVNKIKNKLGKRDSQQIGFTSQQEMRNLK